MNATDLLDEFVDEWYNEDAAASNLALLRGELVNLRLNERDVLLTHCRMQIVRLGQCAHGAAHTAVWEWVEREILQAGCLPSFAHLSAGAQER